MGGSEMVTNKKVVSFVLALILVLCIAPAFCQATSDSNVELGNTPLNIINGGVMLTGENDFWYSEGGIYRETADSVVLLTEEAGENLNLCDDYLYYTLKDGTVRRIAAYGGSPETVYTFGNYIKQLYVINGNELRFISNGMVYSFDLNKNFLSVVSAPANVMSLIPTEYGNIYLTGEIFDYTVYAGEVPVIYGATSAYTDKGHLVVSIDGDDYQASLSTVFSGDFSSARLEKFDLYGEVDAVELLESVDEECDVEPDDSKYDGIDFSVSLLEDEPTQTPEVSEGQRNMVKRARQLHEIKWTPIEDRYQWGYRGVFTAGTTVTGLAYGQPVNVAGYVGYNISLEKYKEAVNDNTSAFYTQYSTYNKIAPTYSTDCSGFVSYSWGLTNRTTTYGWSNIATKVSDQSIYSLQVGDALNHSTSHIVMVSDVQYDSEGNMVQVTIMEQTPVKTKLTVYGEGGKYPLSRIQSYYLSGGYAIYRYEDRDNVTYTHSCAVPIDGDYCANCKAEAPVASTSKAIGQKTVTLKSEYSDGVIYYTTDGSTPTYSSNVYTGPLTFTSTTTLKAIVKTSGFSNGYVLTYKVEIAPVGTPTASAASGLMNGDLVSSGTEIKLSTTTDNATLYYTTDGSAPTTSSTKYTAPIKVTQATTIKVMGVAPGCTASETATFSYRIGQTYTITASAGTGGSISPTGSNQVLETSNASYTIKANSGYKISSVTVDGVNVGTVSSYSFSGISGNHTISVSFVASTTIPFTDVPSGAWYYNAVAYAYANNLFSGTSETTFSPEVSMTRSMFVTVLGRLAGESEYTGNTGILTGSSVNIRQEANTSSKVVGTTHKYQIVKILGSTSADGYTWYNIETGGKTGYIRGDFIKAYKGNLSDLTDGNYYTGYTQWAYLSGILDGVASGSFNPLANVTREEMAIMIYNYVAKYGVKLKTVNEQTSFADDYNISSQAKRTAIYALQQWGVLNGTGDGNCAPKGTVTRSQVAQIFMNLLEAKKK